MYQYRLLSSSFNVKSFIIFSDGYTTSDIRFHFLNGEENAISGIDNVKLAQFELIASELYLKNVSFATGRSLATQSLQVVSDFLDSETLQES